MTTVSLAIKLHGAFFFMYLHYDTVQLVSGSAEKQNLLKDAYL